MLATKRLVVAAVALPLVLTACAEKERVVPTEHATPIAVPSVPATVFPKPTTLAPTTEAPSETASSAPTATTAPTGGGGGDTVLAKGTAFEPNKLEVKVGTKVTWNAAPGEFHSVDSGTPDTGADPAGPLKAPVGFTTYSYTFSKAGTFKYFCQPHASLGMTGEIVVS